MKRILIIGSSGSGKTTFSQRLNSKLHLPLIHLDQHYWKPGWVKPESLDWDETVKRLVAQEAWVMDGNYRSTLHMRLPRADTIIFLDFPRWYCLWGILKRRFWTNRLDVLEGSPERIGWDLLRWVLWRYPQHARKDMIERLERRNEDQKLVILRSRKEIENFLDSIIAK